MSAQPQTFPQVTPQRIMQLTWGFVPTLAIQSAIQNRIFDVLEHGPRTVDQVAHETGCAVRGIKPVMELLAGLELLSRDNAGRYSLTPESATFLVSGKPSFYGGIIRHTSQQLIRNFIHLPDIVRTGEPAEKVSDPQIAPEFFAKFVEDLIPLGYPAAQVLANHLLGAMKHEHISVLDLAAGSGVWSIPFAQASPKVRVTAVDFPRILEITRKVTKRFQVADCYDYRPGDLLDADFGEGHSVATLGQILHSEGERRSRALLKKTFHALAPGGTIAIAEILVDEDRSGPMQGLMFAITMLVHTTEGSTYSFAQIRSWLEEAGFRNARLLEVPAPSPLILADKPGLAAA